MEMVEAIGKKLELGIYRTSKPIKEEKKKEDPKSPKNEKKDSKEDVPSTSSPRSSSSSPLKSPEPHSQKLLVKNKKDKHCFAEARVERRTVAREAAHKTVSLPSVSRFEKVLLEIKAPAKKQPPAATSNGDCSEQGEASSTTAHLVEQKLNEIAKQAEELAKNIRKAADEIPGDEEEVDTKTEKDVDSLVLDLEEEKPTVLHVEVAAPVVKESLSLPSPKKKEESKRTTHSSDSEQRAPQQQNSELKKLAEATRSLLEIASENEMMKGIPPAMSTSDIRSDRISLADRLTKGLHELTHGSSDRLQKWKTKLNSSGRLRSKDQSAPPPSSRSMLSAAPTSEVILDWSTSSDRSPRPLHTSKSAQNAIGKDALPMEHRTLRSKENSASQKDLAFHYQHMNSLQKIMSTFDGYAKGQNFDLPPPAKFMPQSGVKPTHEDIIRPIAFRPVGNKPEHQNSSSIASHRQSHDMIRLERPVIRGQLAKSASNLTQLPTTAPPIVKPKQMFQPSTSFSPAKPQQQQQENEYDTVPDYIEKEKFSDFGSSGSDYGCFMGTKLSSSTASSGSSHLSSPPNTNKKYPSIGSTGRSSSGVHVTPSPSDSGIMDFEFQSVIRDKENELREVRNTMEHNEEVIVKVYQEKERAWKEELDQLKTRLAASERGENALRAQLAGCQRQTDTLSRTVDGLREEKSGLLRKCFQLEREVAHLKQEMDKPKQCAECQRRPIPAPRNIKDNDATLRNEVSSLRDEVATLKDTLNGQIHLFSEERKKWENGNCRQQQQEQISVGRDRLI